VIDALAFGAFALVAYAVISKRTADSVLTAPMWFAALGYLGALLLGEELDLHMQAEWVHLVAEIALVVVLFVDASQIDLARLRTQSSLPVRLLGIGLPLTIALGALVARFVLPEMSWWEAGLIASILAPTDAALGQAVISNRAVPERIRQALPKNSLLVALDERGASWSTEEFAAQLERWQMSGRDLAFAIGGADGLDREKLGAADQRLSLSRMVMPHGLVRVVFVEQLYRAATVLEGHPYHK